MTMTIASLWTSHLPEDKREAFKQAVINSGRDVVLQRLISIIEERRESLEKSERSLKIYENSNWAYMQAHNNGMRQALKLIEDLLNFTKDQDHGRSIRST